jgi:hypothetical protein
VIIRVFRPTIHSGKGAFAGQRWQEAVITPEEEHLLEATWIGHYEVLTVGGAGPAAILEPSTRPSRRR